MSRSFYLRVLILLFVVMGSWSRVAMGDINRDAQGVAIKGYDSVAYFEQNAAVPGKREWTHAWQGAQWRFSSEANRDLFVADPEKYAPQYGGYCAFAVSRGAQADVDPNVWSIVKGKLYLNFNHKVRSIWQGRSDELIRTADTIWSRLNA